VNQDDLYEQATVAHGAALDRLARAYEFDPDARRDLLQEIHLQLWRSFAQFDGRCSTRTWVYRVAHNVATGHVVRQRRVRERLVSVEDVEAMPNARRAEGTGDRAAALSVLSDLIGRLKPLDRQIIVCYLEDLDAHATAEITGVSPGNVAVKIHRIKAIFKRWFDEGGPRD